ncbi:MAG: radical SAM protein [Pseudomonadota bacterium]
MRVLYLQPSMPTLYETPKEPPLGLAMLAAVTEPEGHEVMCLNMEYDSQNRLMDVLNKFKPEVVGLTATTRGVFPAHELAGVIKERLPEATIILGGFGVTVDPEYVLGLSRFDVGVVGEGEATLVELLRAINNNDDLRQVKGLALRENGRVVRTEKRPLIAKLDSLPFPAFEHFDVKGYGKSLPIYTTRGCPHHCIYCSIRNVGARGFRARSPERVVDEMEYLVRRFGLREFSVVDDNFAFNKRRAEAICDEILRRGLKVTWLCGQGLRADNVDYGLMAKMKKAGCPVVAMGVETVNPETMKILRRGITLERIEEAIVAAKKAGMIVKTFNLIGGPGETFADAMRLIEFNQRLKVDIPGYGVYQVFPGTELVQWVKDNARLNPDYSPYTWENPGGEIALDRIPFETDEFSFAERHRAYKIALNSINVQLVRLFLDRHLGWAAKLLYLVLANRFSARMIRKLYLRFLRGRLEPWD